jgi:hypothetical protein
MEKIKLMNDLFLKARREKDDVAKNLFSALKGEFENSIKTGLPNTDETLLKTVKKFIKGLELVGNDQSKLELSILDQFTVKVDTEFIETTVKEFMTAEKIAEVRANSAVMGKYMGMLMKTLGDKGDAKTVKLVLSQLV